MIVDILHYSAISFVAALVSYVMAKGQAIVTQNLQIATAQQPHSSSINAKLNVIALALLEAPALLTSVCIIYLAESRTHTNIYFGIGIIILCITLAIVSSKTISTSSTIASKAGLAIANNPQHGQKINTISLIYISLMQTPLIFLLVICILSIARVSAMSESDYPHIAFFWTMCAPIAIGGSAYGALKGIEKYLSSCMTYAKALPNKFFTAFGKSLLTIAFIEAPVLFSFVISVLTTINIYTEIYQIIPALCGIICFIGVSLSVSWQSAYVSATAIDQKLLSKDIQPKTESSIHQLSFLSQVLLDGRIVYMFIVLIFILLKLNTH